MRRQGAFVPEAECVEVTGSHVGLAVNRQAYRAIAQRSQDPNWTAEHVRHSDAVRAPRPRARD